MKITSLTKILFALLAAGLIFSFNNCEGVGSGFIDHGVPSTKGVEIGNPLTGIAALPKIYLNSQFPTLPNGHRVFTVGMKDRDFTNCQSAVNAASPGDEVVIDAGFVCSHLILTDKGSASDYIVIRTANLQSLPPEGARISKADAPNLAVIESLNDEFAVGIGDLPANSTATSGVNHYYLVGLEIRVNPKVNIPNAYIVKLRNGGTKLEQLPHDIVIGRSWVHGNPNQEIRRGVDLNGLRISIVDSIIEDIHQHGESSQGIAAWDASAGPYKITNNEFAVAGAALLIGWQSSIPNLISSDIEVRKNLFHKLDAWKQPVTSNAGKTGYWALSQTIILRSVQRILFDGNTFANDWARIPSGSTYIGRAFYISPSGFGQSWARVQDVTITNNVMHDIAGGFLISYQDATMPDVIADRIQISNNIAYNLDPANDRGFIWLQGRAEGAVAFDHNTFLANSGQPPIAIMGDQNGTFGQFSFSNNLINDEGAGVLGLGSPTSGAPSLSTQFPGIVFDHNVLAGQVQSHYASYADGNAFPADLKAIGFVDDLSSGLKDYRSLQLSSASPYARAAADGSNLGANIQKVSEALK